MTLRWIGPLIGRSRHGIDVRNEPEDTNRLCDVLDGLLANVHESDLDTPRDDALDGVRHRDATRIGESLQSRGDVYPVAVDRAVGLLDHVTDVNAKAEAHAPVS